MKFLEEKYDVVVVGGGLAGVVAALSSSRTGAKTVIIQNRPVFGGNASSEIKMHICGASMHGKRKDSRETGILDEILMENKLRNPNHSFYIFDAILWEKINEQDNLEYHLNTHFLEANCVSDKIESIKVIQLNAETTLTIEGEIFIDATGDGSLSADSGEEYYFGRNDTKLYNKYSDQEASGTMGNTVMYSSETNDKPVNHIDFKVTNKLTSNELRNRFGFDDPSESSSDEAAAGFWWNELGGEKNVIYDSEEINRDLLKNLFGIYNYAKNSKVMNSEVDIIDWIGFLPGKRESRRIKCKYQLKADDILTNKKFDDAVAFGGWSMDMHNPLGFLDHEGEPTDHIYFDHCYQIPMSSMIAGKNKNLLVTGRLIDTDSWAFSSTRVMGTCAVMGQAVGTAAAVLVDQKQDTGALNNFVSQIKGKLMEDGCYIPGEKLKSRLTYNDFYNCNLTDLFNGKTRGVYTPISTNTLELELKVPELISTVIIFFDNDLTSEVMPTISRGHKRAQREEMPPQLIKDFDITIEYEDGITDEKKIKNNNIREYKVYLEKKLLKKITITIVSNYGATSNTLANIYFK